MVPHIRGQRSGRRPVALAIAAFLLVLLSPTAASAATPSWLDRQAGWHGRAIERPLAPTARAVAPPVRRWQTVSVGSGLAGANGSPAVRRAACAARAGLWRRPGRRALGPRTRSAVGWFQRKHGLSVDGIAGPRTLEFAQRQRVDSTTTDRQPQAQADPQASVPDDVQAPRPTGRVTARSADPGERWLVAAIAVGVILAAILLGLLVRRSRRPTEGTVVSLARPLWVAGVSADPTVGPFAGSAAALHVSPPSGPDGEPAIRYCVIDEQRGTPVWVSPQDIRESRDLDERQRRQAARWPATPPPRAAGASRGRARDRGAPAGWHVASRPPPRTCSDASPGFARWGCPRSDRRPARRRTDPATPGHDTWTAAAVHQIDGQPDHHQPPTAAVAPTHNTGRDDTQGRGT